MERAFFQSFVEAFGFRRWQFLLVEVDFLASRNYFFPFLKYPYCGTYFLSSGNALLSESSNLNGGDAFSVLWKPVFLFNLFQQEEAVTEISGCPLFWYKHFIPTSRKGFSV